MGHRLYQSIPAEFEFDEDHSYFMVRLPVHPAAKEVSEPIGEQVTAQVVAYCQEPKSAREIMTELGLKHWKTFQANYLKPLLNAGILERTIPGKPNSRLQEYRLTEKGRMMT